MTTTISLADPWLHIVAIMAVPVYGLFLWSKQRLKKLAGELKTRGGPLTFAFYLWQLRWQFIAGMVALAVALSLVVGTHRLFVSIKADEGGLILDYPWPRSDVDLRWEEITESAVDTKQFGVSGVTRFCLRVEAKGLVFYSPWSATAKEVRQARELIRTYMSQRQKDFQG